MDKVYCRKCDFYEGSDVGDGHCHNPLFLKGDWESATKYLGDPSKINKNNDCKGFKLISTLREYFRNWLKKQGY